MLSEEFLRDSRKRFAIVGPPVSEAEIVALFPVPFPGRDDVVQFYSNTNGGSRGETGGTFYCGTQAHRVSRDNFANMRLEGFFSLPRFSGERVVGVRSMQRYQASRLRTFSGVPEVKAFLERHKPIAFDHSGNDIWIDLQSGCVRFMDWDAYEDGPVEIASSFREFVTKFWNSSAVG
jgi:hypothetical protein